MRQQFKKKNLITTGLQVVKLATNAILRAFLLPQS